MRLIDADALKNLPFERMIHTDFGDTAIPIEEIDNAPTVEERSKGKWIQMHEGLSLYYHICSNCKITPLELEEYEVLSDFCPHCGADMREVNNNEDTK